LSGHDHHVVDRMINGTRLLKPGLDARKAFVIDITWPSANRSSRIETVSITAELVACKDWPPDPDLQNIADQAYAVLDPLRHTQLAKIPASYRPLTSFNSRGCRVSMGTFLLSRIRDAVNMHTQIGNQPRCHCALLKGGNIRGGRDYESTEQLTLEVLQSELEETKEVVVVPVPGLVLRVGLRETFKVPNPGWMQYDDGVELDEEGFVTHIQNKPLDMSEVYNVATISDFWRKRDGPTIGSYFELHPDELPEPDSGVPMHVLLIRLFAMQIWQLVWKSLEVDFEEGSISEEAFRRIDVDGDGQISKDDLKKAVSDITGFETFASQDVVVDFMLDELLCFKRESSTSNLSRRITQRTLGEAAKHWSTTSLNSMAGDSDGDDDIDDDEQVPSAK